MKFNMLRDIEKVMCNERNRNVYQRDRRFCFHFKGVSYFLTGIEIGVPVAGVKLDKNRIMVCDGVESVEEVKASA